MIIAVTMGDAAGVGPEIILSTFKQGKFPSAALVIGDRCVLEYGNSILGFGVPLHTVESPKEIRDGFLNILDLKQLTVPFPVARVSAETGAAARAYVEKAILLALAKKVDAICTLPMNKEATRLSDPDFTGHTELIAHMCRTDDYSMMLASERLIVTHVSTHVSMLDAVKNITAENVYKIILLTHQALKKLRSQQRIAIAGLNPHAGENGAFGIEEVDYIKPAIENARKLGIDVYGPVPPDTVFLQCLKGKFDAVVCMYHDQGHIPMKLLDFDGGVNVTVGLPIVRTSVDHGTAFDIAYSGTANIGSFIYALLMAARLAS